MCTYLTADVAVAGVGRGEPDWGAVDRAVVYFDHPQQAPFEHALCIDFSGASDAPARRAVVELSATTARQLAAAILATLDSPEAKQLEDFVD